MSSTECLTIVWFSMFDVNKWIKEKQNRFQLSFIFLFLCLTCYAWTICTTSFCLMQNPYFIIFFWFYFFAILFIYFEWLKSNKKKNKINHCVPESNFFFLQKKKQFTFTNNFIIHILYQLFLYFKLSFIKYYRIDEKLLLLICKYRFVCEEKKLTGNVCVWSCVWNVCVIILLKLHRHC